MLAASTPQDERLSKADHLHAAAEHLEAAGFHADAERFRKTESEERAHRAADSTQIVVHVRMLEFSRSELSNLDSEKYGGSKGTSVLKLLEKSQDRQGKPGDFVVAANVDAKLQSLIEDLRKDHRVDVLYEPDLCVCAGRPASLLVGGSIGYQEKDADGKDVTKFKDYGTSVDVVAQIVAKDQIHLDLRIRKSEPDAALAVGTLPAFHTRELETGINVGSGSTCALYGGIEQRPLPASPLSSFGEMLGLSSGPKTVDEIELLVTVKAEIVPKEAAKPSVTR